MVGLGMGRNRAQMIKETAGAELKIVIYGPLLVA